MECLRCSAGVQTQPRRCPSSKRTPAGAPVLCGPLGCASQAGAPSCVGPARPFSQPIPAPSWTPAGARFLSELLCFAFLAYPCACAYYAVYRRARLNRVKCATAFRWASGRGQLCCLRLPRGVRASPFQGPSRGLGDLAAERCLHLFSRLSVRFEPTAPASPLTATRLPTQPIVRRRLGRFAFYRMVPRHTDSYSLCFSGARGCAALLSGRGLPACRADVHTDLAALPCAASPPGWPPAHGRHHTTLALRPPPLTSAPSQRC